MWASGWRSRQSLTRGKLRRIPGAHVLKVHRSAFDAEGPVMKSAV